MQREIKITSDGSKTIYLPEMDENYHSTHGALQEAMHVFIEHGLKPLLKKEEISIFEMGFGTGLNAALTFQESINAGSRIFYEGIEAYPVEAALMNALGYEKFLSHEGNSALKSMHSSVYNDVTSISEWFDFVQTVEKIQNYKPKSQRFDLIYFDAFGPRAQEDMWDKSVLEKMYLMLKKDGVLVTYCAKGSFKRDLKSLGFTVEALPGPPGKREMTRARKI